MSEIPRSEQVEDKLENAREKLMASEKEGKYIFHGSVKSIDILEPRQPYNRSGKTGRMEKHGEPCVCGTQFADIAIFRAIVTPENVEGNFYSGFGINENGNLKFSISKETLEKIKDKKGYVYVLSKSNFKPFSEMEWRSDVELKPEEIVEVTFKDLPQKIDIIDESQTKK